MKALVDLSFQELRNEVRDLLLQREPAAARINQRAQELPFDPLLQAFSEADDEFRSMLGRAALSLLEESVEKPWPIKSFQYLQTTLEETKPQGLEEKLQSFASGGYLRSMADGDQRLVGVLSTLLEQGWKGTPRFWTSRDEAFKRSYPELIFRGLLAHGLDVAADFLPALAIDRRSAVRISGIFPSLIESEGLARVKKLVSRAVVGCPSTVRELYSRWFSLQLVGLSGDSEESLAGNESKRFEPVAKSVEGAVGSYIHAGGIAGVLVEVRCETSFLAETSAFQTLVRDIAMHIVAAKPRFVRREEVTDEELERQREIFGQQMRAEIGPERVFPKFIEAKVERFYSESVLLEQPFIKDPDKTLGQLIVEKTAEFGENIQVYRFVRFECGEGLEEEQPNQALNLAAVAEA